MDVSDKNAKLWVNEHKKRDGGKWYDYSLGASRKLMEGGWANISIKAKFSKDVAVPEPLANGTKISYEGFMTVDIYEDRDGNEVRKPMIMITKASFPELEDIPVDSFASMEEDIPFN